MPGLSVTDEGENITNTSVVNKKNNWFNFLTNIFYPFFSYNTSIVNSSCTGGYRNIVSINSSSTNGKNKNIISINGNKFVIEIINNLIYINNIPTDISCNNGQIISNVVNGIIYINGNKIDSEKYI